MTEADKALAVSDVAERWWEQDGVYRPPICQISPVTREFVEMGHADPSPLEPGVWLFPAGAYEGNAPVVLPGCVAILNEFGTSWTQVADNRGKTVYDTVTRIASVYEVLGDLPEGLTLEAPSTDFDVWQEGRWVFDAAARNAALIQQAGLKKTLLTQCAANQISTLQYAVDKDIATDAEVAELDAWRGYSVALNRVNAGVDTVWPIGPDAALLSSWLASRGYEDLPDLPTTETN